MSVSIKNIAQPKSQSNLKEFLNKDIQIGAQFNLKKKQSLFNDLYLLFHSGLDMKRVLELVVNEQKNKKDKALLERVYKKVVSGISLSQALSEEKDFTEYEVYSIKIGEESGQLSEVLFHLKNYFHKRIEQKRLVTSALSYPITILGIAVAAVTFMIGFVVPTFADTFKSFGAELPPVTRWLVQLSDDFGFYAIVFSLILIITFVGYQLVKSTDVVKMWKDRILLGIPFTGKIYHLGKLTQFCENMRLLIGAKTSLIEALNLTGRMSSFYPIQSNINRISFDVTNGVSLSNSLSKFKTFPSRMIYLIAVGEEVNKLEDIFGQLSELYGNELEHKSKILGNVLEPVLLLFIACLVGFIVIALYMPMFSLSELI
ncbi:MAG: general secretion pathway protein GspF [Flavobacteriales bacterium]|nr:general secretion pathway protein GspF [Flavobacteriales bacterium]